MSDVIIHLSVLRGQDKARPVPKSLKAAVAGNYISTPFSLRSGKTNGAS
jgi:hypothetical protein